MIRLEKKKISLDCIKRWVDPCGQVETCPPQDTAGGILGLLLIALDDYFVMRMLR